MSAIDPQNDGERELLKAGRSSYEHERLAKHAQENNYKLSDNAPAIIKAIAKKDGCCPCMVTRVPCPCISHHADIQDTGKCHCGLFIADNDG